MPRSYRCPWTMPILAALLAGCGARVTPPGVNLGPPPDFATYLGGSAEDQPRDVAVDLAGNVYVVGGTASFDYPTSPGAAQPIHHPGPPSSSGIQPFDVVVTKLDRVGTIVWSTYLGGPNYDRAYGVEVDAQGFVYVAGRAGPGFPVTPGSLQVSHRGGTEASLYGPQDGFVCKLRPEGTVVFCTYFGASDPSIVRDLAVDQNGDIYIASGWSGGSWPPQITAAFNNAPHGDRDAVVAKISADGSRVLWATYLGGSSWESNENSIGVDAGGNPYVLLTTRSDDAQTTPGAFQRVHAGMDDLYIAKLNPQAGSLVWASYLGGSGNESTETHELAVGRLGDVFIVTSTGSRDFPIAPNAAQPALAGGPRDMSVTHLSPDGTRRVGSTYLGGNGNDRPEGVAVDDSGNIYLTGVTGSTNFPVTANAYQPQLGGKRDAVVVKLPPELDRILYASHLGGSGDDFGQGAAASGAGRFFLIGQTESLDFPTVRGLQSYRGNFDGFVAAFRLP